MFSSALLSWRSCKQKAALSKARAAELGTSPEGEKLQSDSGVFLDSQSLQDNQPSKGVVHASSLKLPLGTKERLLRQEGEGILMKLTKTFSLKLDFVLTITKCAEMLVYA